MSRHHQLIKNDPRWHAARAACLERDESTCVDCGITAEELEGAPLAERLQADHIEELSVAPELAFEVDNLRTLCGDCHRKRHREAGLEVHRLHWINPKYAPALEVAGVS